MDERYIKLSDAKYAIMDYIGEQTVSKYPSAELCKASRMGAEGAMNELDYVPSIEVVPKAKYELAVAEREANVKGFAEDIAKAKSEIAKKICCEIEEEIVAALESNYETLRTTIC